MVMDSSSCSTRVFRSSNLYPYESYSDSNQPAPMPNSSLPLLIASSVDVIFAKSGGCLKEFEVTICPTLSFDVTDEIAERSMYASNKVSLRSFDGWETK